MRPTLTILMMVFLFNACGLIRGTQKVKYQLPMLGSIGKHQSSLFKRKFQKVGEPFIDNPVAVTFESVAFDKSAESRYSNYRKNQGKEPATIFTDTTSIDIPRYYQLKISNIVRLVGEMNGDENNGLKKYLQENMDLEIMSHIVFMTDIKSAQQMENADLIYLKTSYDGVLILYVGNRYGTEPIKISNLEIFDFRTARFCWDKDKRGHINIAQILMDGITCPGSTKANPEKLNRTPDYLKL
ncbi:hypothetical protein GUA46_06960 [Muricauda sp. HICW]|uniref:Uncharacterized protein n=1 Tax=Flagellimonas chongwuensis TaxID=2697365 RepID=A0A850NDL1_9FLAO|nr:hypothetical protein [Allomuricauda chongwuensis]NVN18074.1 hypothetical protein [Allomuricauda chongwuensis]